MKFLISAFAVMAVVACKPRSFNNVNSDSELMKTKTADKGTYVPHDKRIVIKDSVVTEAKYSFLNVKGEVGTFNGKRATRHTLQNKDETTGKILATRSIVYVQLDRVKNMQDAKSACEKFAPAGIWRIMTASEFLAMLMVGNPGGFYDSKVPFSSKFSSGSESGSGHNPMWIYEYGQGAHLTIADGRGTDLFPVEKILSEYDVNDENEAKQIEDLKSTHSYCVNGSL